jgi:hypothetical protein
VKEFAPRVAPDIRRIDGFALFQSTYSEGNAVMAHLQTAGEQPGTVGQALDFRQPPVGDEAEKVDQALQDQHRPQNDALDHSFLRSRAASFVDQVSFGNLSGLSKMAHLPGED